MLFIPCLRKICVFFITVYLQELSNDNKELRRQVCSQVEQLSALRGDLDLRRLSQLSDGSTSGNQVMLLTETLDQEREGRLRAEEQLARVEQRLEEAERVLRHQAAEKVHLAEELQARDAEDAVVAATANGLQEVNALNKRLRKEVRDLKVRIFHSLGSNAVALKLQSARFF